jgi:hypothetical protein
MTGRGMGYCAGYPVPGYLNPPGWGWGYGRGGGWGRGRGFRHWRWRYPPAPFFPGYAAPYAPPAPVSPPSDEAELEFLKSEAARLEAALKEINARIKELSQEDDAE